MKKSIFFILITLCIKSKTVAQDKLYLKDNSVVDANIIEISETNVNYKLVANPSGPLYIISKNKISKIIYRNGSVEVVKDILEQPTLNNKSIPVKKAFVSTKKNFIRLYFTDILFDKISFGYERKLNKKYSLEIDAFYKYPNNSIYASDKWSRSFVFWYEGGEMKIGASRHFQIKDKILSIGTAVSYRQQVLSHQTFFTGMNYYPNYALYNLSQKRQGIGVFSKFNIQFNPLRSGCEFFIIVGVYVAQTKNEYHWYKSDLGNPNTYTTDPNNIPKLKTWYMKEGFAMLPYINFGFDYKIKQAEKGWHANLKRERDSLKFSRKNIILFNPLQLFDGNIGGTYMRVLYKHAISLYNSVAVNVNNNGCPVSSGLLIEKNANYYLTRKNFDVNLSVNYNFSKDQQGFLFMGPLFRLAQFEGTCYNHDFTLNKFYTGLNIGGLGRTDKGLSFLTSFGFGLYNNDYVKGNANPYMMQHTATICDRGLFANLSMQLGYSF